MGTLLREYVGHLYADLGRLGAVFVGFAELGKPIRGRWLDIWSEGGAKHALIGNVRVVWSPVDELERRRRAV